MPDATPTPEPTPTMPDATPTPEPTPTTPDVTPMPDATPTPEPTPTPTIYTLTVNSTDGGLVTHPGEGKFTYAAGTVVNLVAVADPNQEFGRWQGKVITVADTNAADTTITMNGDYNITANFSVVTYTLTISSTAGGSVSEPGEGIFTYSAGTVVDLLAVADDGYEFDEWTGNVADISSPITTITIVQLEVVTAHFVPQH